MLSQIHQTYSSMPMCSDVNNCDIFLGGFFLHCIVFVLVLLACSGFCSATLFVYSVEKKKKSYVSFKLCFISLHFRYILFIVKLVQNILVLSSNTISY